MSFLDRWLGRSKPAVPGYTILQTVPAMGVPDELAGIETSPGFTAAVDQLRDRFLAAGAQPGPDAPLFVTLARARGESFCLDLPDGIAVLAFTTPLRAADYMRVQSLERHASGFQLTSARRNAEWLAARGKQEPPVQGWVLDRCPRCDTVCLYPPESLADPGQAIAIWALSRASTKVRRDYEYLFAVRAARAGDHRTAMGVAMHIVGHVTPDDALVHLLIGKLAIAWQDAGIRSVLRSTLAEAKAFLAALAQPQARTALAELAQAEKAGTVGF